MWASNDASHPSSHPSSGHSHRLFNQRARPWRTVSTRHIPGLSGVGSHVPSLIHPTLHQSPRQPGLTSPAARPCCKSCFCNDQFGNLRLASTIVSYLPVSIVSIGTSRCPCEAGRHVRERTNEISGRHKAPRTFSCEFPDFVRFSKSPPDHQSAKSREATNWET